MTSPLVLLILIHPQGLRQQSARHQRDQHRQGNERLDGITFPRPRARVATGTLGADAKTAQRTARPALVLAGGEPFAPPTTSGCAGTQPGVGGAIQPRGSAGYNRTACGNDWAGVTPAGPLSALTAGTAQAGRLGGRRPAVTLFLSSQS